ncbi:GNAT family N-acetyltransferase [Mucilaginibacter sp. AW1-3]
MSFAGQIAVKQLSVADLALTQQLFILLQEVFGIENPIKVSDSYVDKLLSNTNFVALAAIYQSEVVGGLTAYRLPMYDKEEEELFIYDIAVRPAFQRNGIGKQLINAAKQFCRKQNVELMFVQADAEDIHALDFYRSTRAKEERTVQFIYPLS